MMSSATMSSAANPAPNTFQKIGRKLSSMMDLEDRDTTITKHTNKISAIFDGKENR